MSFFLSCYYDLSVTIPAMVADGEASEVICPLVVADPEALRIAPAYSGERVTCFVGRAVPA